MFNQLFGNREQKHQLPDLTVGKIGSYLEWEEAQDLDQVYQAMLGGITIRSEDQQIEYLPASVHLTEVNFRPQIFYFTPNYQKIGHGNYIEIGFHRDFRVGVADRLISTPSEISKIKISPILPPTRNKVKWYLKRIYYVFAIVYRSPIYGIIAHFIGRRRFEKIYRHLHRYKKNYLFGILTITGIGGVFGLADRHYNNQLITPHFLSGMLFGASLTNLGSYIGYVAAKSRTYDYYD